MSKVAASSCSWVGEADPLVADQGDADAADRAGERQAGELGGQRRGVDRDDVVQVVGVQRHHGDDDLDLVAQALDEARAQRAVDQPAGEDRALGRAALAAEERAGDAARGVHPLLDVDRQREEVEVLLGVLAGRGGRQQHGVVVEVDGDGAGGLPGQPARSRSGSVRVPKRAVVDDGLGGTERSRDPDPCGCLLLLSWLTAAGASWPDGRSSIEALRERGAAGGHYRGPARGRRVWAQLSEWSRTPWAEPSVLGAGASCVSVIDAGRAARSATR